MFDVLREELEIAVAAAGQPQRLKLLPAQLPQLPPVGAVDDLVLSSLEIERERATSALTNRVNRSKSQNRKTHVDDEYWAPHGPDLVDVLHTRRENKQVNREIKSTLTFGLTR